MSESTPAPDAAVPPAVADSPRDVRWPGWRREVLVGLAVLVGAVASGPLLGLLWAAVGPRVQVRMTSQGPALVNPEPEQFIADEGWYLIITVAFAVIVTLVLWAVLQRYRGPVMLVALAAGFAGAGVLAWWVGSHLGLDHYHELLKHAPVGSRFAKPVGLRAQKVGLWSGWLPSARGDVLMAGVAATVTYVLLAGFASQPDLQRPRDGDGVAGVGALAGDNDAGGAAGAQDAGTAPG